MKFDEQKALEAAEKIVTKNISFGGLEFSISGKVHRDCVAACVLGMHEQFEQMKAEIERLDEELKGMALKFIDRDFPLIKERDQLKIELVQAKVEIEALEEYKYQIIKFRDDNNRMNEDEIIKLQSQLDQAMGMMDSVRKGWIKHQMTKFTSDGSHFQADIEMNETMGKIGLMIAQWRKEREG